MFGRQVCKNCFEGLNLEPQWPRHLCPSFLANQLRVSTGLTTNPRSQARTKGGTRKPPSRQEPQQGPTGEGAPGEHKATPAPGAGQATQGRAAGQQKRNMQGMNAHRQLAVSVLAPFDSTHIFTPPPRPRGRFHECYRRQNLPILGASQSDMREN